MFPCLGHSKQCCYEHGSTDFFFKLFIYFWLHLVFVAVYRLLLVAESGGQSLVVMRGLLIAVASLVAEHGL